MMPLVGTCQLTSTDCVAAVLISLMEYAHRLAVN